MKLAYREYGKGQALIILHGLFGQSDNWNTLAKQFGEQGYSVFTLDLRNHGLSPHSEEWNYSEMANDLYEFIATHNLEHPILLGHSMGGKVVLFFENKFPGLASKLIIADIAPRAYEPHHNEVLSALRAVDFSLIKTRKEAETKMTEHLADFGTSQFLLKNIYWRDTENNIMDWRFNLKVILEKYNNIGVAVPEFKSETKCLVIAGEKSNYISEKDKTDFSNRFKNCSFETIVGAGHWVHAEKPKEFLDVVLKFIKV